MGLNFTPKKESEVSSGFDNLPPGEYGFTVMESDLVPSKSAKNQGRMMVMVKLNIHGPEFDRHVYDYFSDWFSEWKLKHFCEVVGLGGEYLKGEISPERNAWQGRTGFVKVKIKPAQSGYAEGNEVVDYLPDDDQKVDAENAAPVVNAAHKPAAAPKPKPAGIAQTAQDDDVPF